MRMRGVGFPILQGEFFKHLLSLPDDVPSLSRGLFGREPKSQIAPWNHSYIETNEKNANKRIELQFHKKRIC
jgi:hypothetical protein